MMNQRHTAQAVHPLRRWPLSPVCLAVALLALPPLAQGLPTGPQTVLGQAGVKVASPGQMLITQGTDKAIIDWRSFSIDLGELVRIDQPNAGSVLLNRVVGVDPSMILGRLQSNGEVLRTRRWSLIVSPETRLSQSGQHIS